MFSVPSLADLMTVALKDAPFSTTTPHWAKAPTLNRWRPMSAWYAHDWRRKRNTPMATRLARVLTPLALALAGAAIGASAAYLLGLITR